MLTKPNLADEEIAQCLRDAYGLSVETITFLPLGADFNTAVYRIVTTCGEAYFLKLRRGEFNEASVLVPKYLATLGFQHVISPLSTLTGQLWASLKSFKVILYSYVEGHNGIEAPLSDEQWIEFGVFMKQFHSADIPQAITRGVGREGFSPKWREAIKDFFGRIGKDIFEEPVAAQMALFLKSKRDEVLGLVRRAEELGRALQGQSLDYVFCHADLHSWNLLINQSGEFFVVDWDTLMFASKERDLMFIGAGIGNSGRSASEEERLFYQGYGDTSVNHDAIAYYRYMRIIEDVGEYCELIFSSDEGGEDHMQSFEYLRANFCLVGQLSGRIGQTRHGRLSKDLFFRNHIF